MMSSKIVLVTLLGLVMISCNKDEEESIPVTVKSNIEFKVINEIDGEALVFNEMNFANAAGNEYEVTRLEYYLSDFAFQNSNGDWYRPHFEPVLINGLTQNQTFVLENVIQGDYVAFSFMVGLPVIWNYTGMLENTLENLNMAWPENLGGGYHFMKFEGNYLDDIQVVRGFTVHLGQNGMQSVNEFNNLQMNVNSTTGAITLNMNLNEWFDNPNLFDFNIDGNYTMAIDSLMKKVSDNGRNCFTISLPI